jgi:molecular chaperone GrpE (heat shock protein)
MMTSDPHLGFGLVLTVGLTVLFWSFFSAQVRTKHQSASGAIATDTAELKRLRQHCQQLEQQLQQVLQTAQPQSDADIEPETSTNARVIQQDIIQQLQPLLTRYPSVQQASSESPVSAQTIATLLEPIETLLETWGLEAIGSPGDSVPYTPELHHLEDSEIQAGESVYIYFVGYRQGDRILYPAVVSRTPPDLTTPKQALMPPIPEPTPELLPRPVRPDEPPQTPHSGMSATEGENWDAADEAETADYWLNPDLE